MYVLYYGDILLRYSFPSQRPPNQVPQLADSVIYDSLPQLHGVCHQLEKRWDMHDLLLFRKNRRGTRSVILKGHRSVKIPIPRRCTSVSLTRNVVCRRYTNITRVKITRVIFDPGQNDGSVDAAYVYFFVWNPAFDRIS